MVARLNVIFTPKVSFEVYLQPLVSSGQYYGLKERARPRTFEFTRSGVDAGTIAYDEARQVYTIDPDADGPAAPFKVQEPSFNYRSLRLNAVFRWEWRLGSTLYAVWTQNRQDYATSDFSLGRDFTAMAGAPGDNVFMVKMAYWSGR